MLFRQWDNIFGLASDKQENPDPEKYTNFSCYLENIKMKFLIIWGIYIDSSRTLPHYVTPCFWEGRIGNGVCGTDFFRGARDGNEENYIKIGKNKYI